MLIIVLLIGILSASDAARILVAVQTPSYSHQIIFQPIYKELARRGHEVVVLTTDPIKEHVPNIRTIDLRAAYEPWRKYNDFFISNTDPFKFLNAIYDIIGACTEIELGHPEVQALIKNETEHFDLVISEFLFPSMLAFKHRFNSSLIGVTTLDAFSDAHNAVGNTIHNILYPDADTVPYKEKTTFWERLYIVAVMNPYKYFARRSFVAGEDASVRKFFGEGYPPLDDIRKTVDMLFINVNLAFNFIRPVTPATIRIGGLHINPPKPLPKDLKEYLDNESGGVIYFSLGTNVKSTIIPTEIRERIMKALSELPYKVLWKFENDELPGLPKNVKIMKWIPQQDVIRHKNIKAFITQGGLQSLEESLYANVPIIGMPFFGDQIANIQKIAALGLGLAVDYRTVSSKELKDTILEVINNPKYKKRVVEIASLLKDEPMPALERAVWWVEYVLRHKGAQHLKGPGTNMPIYEYYYLDVVAFVSILLFTMLYSVYFILKKLCRCCFSKKVKSE